MIKKSHFTISCIRHSVFFIRGQSLFEVILALAISAIIMTGIVSLTSTSVNTSTLSKNKSQANRYAAQAMEFVRKEKAFLEWDAFIAEIGSGPWCLKKLEFSADTSHACGANEYLQDPVGTNTIFIRELTILASASADIINYQVVVSWVDEKGTHETRTTGSVGNW